MDWLLNNTSCCTGRNLFCIVILFSIKPLQLGRRYWNSTAKATFTTRIYVSLVCFCKTADNLRLNVFFMLQLDACLGSVFYFLFFLCHNAMLWWVYVQKTLSKDEDDIMVYLRKPVLVSTRTAWGGPTSYDKRWFGFPHKNIKTAGNVPRSP